MLFSWGSWTYTGPEFVACPGGPCYSTLYQIEVPVLNGVQFAALAVASGYPLVAWFDPRRPQRLLGIAATVAVACALCVRVVDPASVVDLADGGFLFPIATLTTAGALAVFVLSSGVLCWGLASGVAWRRPRRSPPSPAQVLRDILEQGPPAP